VYYSVVAINAIERVEGIVSKVICCVSSASLNSIQYLITYSLILLTIIIIKSNKQLNENLYSLCNCSIIEKRTINVK